ncbi:hypothetical protein V9T40_013245 [Parthenolecanium corni]|uniref:Uncharacterized protein n=1 Tax=Parthenolecanium corni TaxID=536013 RepID=A0AAN9TIR5_9HEMI
MIIRVSRNAFISSLIGTALGVGFLVKPNFVKNSLDVLLPDEENVAPWLWAVSEKWTRPSLVESS